MGDLSQLSDEAPDPQAPFTTVEARLSDRLSHLLSHLPKYTRALFTHAVDHYGVRSLAALCAKTPRELKKWKLVGKKCLHDVVGTLATFGLSLATSPSSTASTPIYTGNLPMVRVRMEGGRPVARSEPFANTPRAEPRIYCVVVRDNGQRSTAEISGKRVNDDMRASAEDLLETLTTGQRPPIRGLYDLCARAFGTTREDAKKRITAACYGKQGEALT